MSRLMNIMNKSDRNIGWTRRVLERMKRRLVEATPKTRVVGRVKVMNLRPTIRALVERRARELMAQRLIALTEMRRRGMLDDISTVRNAVVEPVLL